MHGALRYLRFAERNCTPGQLVSEPNPLAIISFCNYTTDILCKLFIQAAQIKKSILVNYRTILSRRTAEGSYFFEVVKNRELFERCGELLFRVGVVYVFYPCLAFHMTMQAELAPAGNNALQLLINMLKALTNNVSRNQFLKFNSRFLKRHNEQLATHWESFGGRGIIPSRWS